MSAIKRITRIAIPTPTWADTAYNDRSWGLYAQAVDSSGGEAVRVPLTLGPSALRKLLTDIDGICLPGSPADVRPELYGAAADPATAPADPAREMIDFGLLDHAEATGKPVLAICFGLQSLNVWRGGSLVQDLTPVPVNHSAGGQVAVAHTALVAAASRLGELIAASPQTLAEAPLEEGFYRLPVNTSHHQAVSRPGDHLHVTARSPEDGVVEAVEGETLRNDPAQMMLGVQWHPERSFAISAVSRALFGELVQTATLPSGVRR